MSYCVLPCANTLWRVQSSTCTILHTECTYLPTNIWLGKPLLQPPPVAQHSKNGSVAIHLDAVNIIAASPCTYGQLTSVLFEECLYMENCTLSSPFLYTLACMNSLTVH